ncbi:hypothetical protein [Methylocystis iwaonis]|uniref:Uncharacterized protein n=1 Tax=Methylocystis iwaonis TaxID=2885079 RepID=A0ABM8E6X3_9HYPH|nr:hypothetical protein [Methylocystis iwaonis]BDV33589.1 hypothetical protein SS37A_11180 [Methylocystis iwaonis]
MEDFENEETAQGVVSKPAPFALRGWGIGVIGKGKSNHMRVEPWQFLLFND